MAKTNQILQIDPPSEITFRGPFTDVVTSYLKLSNPADRQVCFKVKTTAPKQYCVRPNSGFIPPKGSVTVAVMLQPFEFNAEDKNKHKFMVQTAFVPEGETSLDNIWKSIQGQELMDSKLRVQFEMPDSQSNVEKLKQTPQKTSNSAEQDLRKALDDNKRLQSHLQRLESDNATLKDKVHRYEMSPSPAGRDFSTSSLYASGGISMLHIFLVAVVALLFGLLFGKLF